MGSLTCGSALFNNNTSQLSQHEQAETVRTLLHANADVTKLLKSGDTPLGLAVKVSGGIGLVASNRDKDFNSILTDDDRRHFFEQVNNLELVDTLLDAGAPIENGCSEINGEFYSPMRIAAWVRGLFLLSSPFFVTHGNLNLPFCLAVAICAVGAHRRRQASDWSRRQRQ